MYTNSPTFSIKPSTSSTNPIDGDLTVQSFKTNN